jgi:Zn-dependent protease
MIAFLLISWSLATFFMPGYLPGLTPVEYWIMGAAGAIILFISVLIHELAHSKLATKYGVKVNQIVLFLFGGVSDIAGELKDYRKDAKMAIAGPLTSFAISAAFFVALLAVTNFVGGDGAAAKVVLGIFYYGALINLMLGVFNLIPAFPSDGGRILRAALMRKKKDYNEATKIAANVGIAISYAFMGVGFFAMLAGSFVSGLWILLIGWFLMSGAQSYVSQIQLTSALASLRVKDIMNTNILSVKGSFPAGQLLDSYFRTYMKGAFPVLDDEGILIGMITLKKLLEVDESRRALLRTDEIMIARQDLPVLSPDVTADHALTQMTKSKLGKVFVCNEDGKLVGLVTKTDIMDVEIERGEITQTLKGHKL